ncbi:hypothetical protein DMENIID0001_048550 [Sergentomyia squamirostris]
MWFRPGSSIDSDRFRVSNFKNRIRGRKSSKSVCSEYPTLVEQGRKEDESLDGKKSKSVDDEMLAGGEAESKEKILLTDPKFKNNRIAKSSSKGKISAEIDGKTVHVVMTTGRKISAPPILESSNAKKSSQRAHSNLNLNALLRYTLANTNKRLSSEEFDRIRRKSLSESAAVASSPHKSSDDVTGVNTSDEKIPDDQEMTVTLKTVSPKNSLTSRVAAKLSESRGKKSSKGKRRKGARKQSSGTALNILCDRPLTTSVTRQPSDRRPDTGGSSHHHPHASVGSASGGSSVDFQSPLVAESGEIGAPLTERASHESSKSKSAPVSVNRSESYKERLSHKRNRTNRRKTSDPSLTKTNDEQQVDLGLTNTNYAASSSSSLSSNSLDSPSISFEAVGAPPPTAGTHVGLAPRSWVESDEEGGGDCETDWSSNVASDVLATLSDAEKKRQEIINEIYQTERNHVRTLRLLEGIFMQPLQESGVLNAEHLHLLFPPALLLLKDLHSSFEAQLKQRRLDTVPLVGDIGDLLLGMFDGKSGEDLKENAAQFCARQQIALEALKEKRRKDENLQRLLTKAEAHKACRRLQLKDLLPTALQRLTKYPLLFESLHKITLRVSPDNTAEAEAIQKALDNSRDILNHVNQAVRVAEDAHKLQTIQKKLDKVGYDKEMTGDTKTLMQNLDLTQHKLIHDGLLIMKKSPTIQLHGLLFEDIMVLLQKQDDRYVLKVLPNPGAGSAENKSKESVFYPLIKVNLILVRQSAVDKTTFFLINTSVSQMLELTTPSSSECKG